MESGHGAGRRELDWEAARAGLDPTTDSLGALRLGFPRASEPRLLCEMQRAFVFGGFRERDALPKVNGMGR